MRLVIIIKMGALYFGLFLIVGKKLLTYETIPLLEIDLGSFLVELAFLWQNINVETLSAIAGRINLAVYISMTNLSEFF